MSTCLDVFIHAYVNLRLLILFNRIRIRISSRNILKYILQLISSYISRVIVQFRLDNLCQQGGNVHLHHSMVAYGV